MSKILCFGLGLFMAVLLAGCGDSDNIFNPTREPVVEVVLPSAPAMSGANIARVNSNVPNVNLNAEGFVISNLQFGNMTMPPNDGFPHNPGDPATNLTLPNNVRYITYFRIDQPGATPGALFRPVSARDVDIQFHSTHPAIVWHETGLIIRGNFFAGEPAAVTITVSYKGMSRRYVFSVVSTVPQP